MSDSCRGPADAGGRLGQRDLRLAERLSLLGTETAFAVSAEAAAHAAKGNVIFPFHLGDMNIPTPKNIVEAAAKAIADGKTGYCSNYGVPELREILEICINKLPERKRAMLELRYLLDLPTSDITGLFQRGLRLVQSELKGARESLADCLRQHGYNIEL